VEFVIYFTSAFHFVPPHLVCVLIVFLWIAHSYSVLAAVDAECEVFKG